MLYPNDPLLSLIIHTCVTVTVTIIYTGISRKERPGLIGVKWAKFLQENGSYL